MAVKRKRKSTTVTNAARPAKKTKSTTTPFPFMSLPAELIDDILTRLIPISMTIENTFYPGYDVPIIPFFSPILRVCRALRQRGLDIIASKVLWTSVVVNCSEEIDILFDIQASKFPFLPSVFREALPQHLSTSISIRVEPALRRSPRTRPVTDDPEAIWFLYSYSDFLNLLNMLSSLFPHEKLSVTLPRQLPLHAKIVDAQVEPAMRVLCQTFNLYIYRQRDRSDLLPELLSMTPGTKSYTPTVRQALKGVHRMLRIADQLEKVSMHEEAAVWLCYCGPSIFHAGGRLDRALDFAVAQSDPGSAADESMSRRRFDKFGNELRTLLHQLDYRAVLGFQKLALKYRDRFLLQYFPLFTYDGARWWTETIYPTFGLSDKQRAELHHARALMKLIVANAYPPTDSLLGRRPEYLTYTNPDFVLYNSDKEELYADSILEMAYACTVDPGNDQFRAFYNGLWKYPADICKDHFALDDVTGEIVQGLDNVVELPQEVSSATGITTWTGDPDMLEEWGGPEALRCLSLAQKTPSEDELKQLYDER